MDSILPPYCLRYFGQFYLDNRICRTPGVSLKCSFFGQKSFIFFVLKRYKRRDLNTFYKNSLNKRYAQLITNSNNPLCFWAALEKLFSLVNFRMFCNKKENFKLECKSIWNSMTSSTGSVAFHIQTIISKFLAKKGIIL